MTIRPFRETDRQALHRITVRCFEQASMHATAEKLFGRFKGRSWQERKVAEIDAECAANPEGVLVAVEGEEVAGFVTTRLDHSTGIGHIPNIAVDPSHQGKGLGTALLRSALQYLADQGMTHVKIETLEQNAVGRHLYPKLGFREIARQIHYMMEISEEDPRRSSQKR